MKINLRKASVVQQTIQDEIKRLGTESMTLKVSLFETDILGLLDGQMEKIRANHAHAGRLMNANRFLRAIVAKKNAEVGITDYLAEEAMLASVESRLKSYSEAEVRQNLEALGAEAESRKTGGSERSIYGREYTIDVHVVPAEAVAEAKKELETVRRRRRKIKDEMVTINVRTEFEVPEQVALVLTELGLD